jgi:hypothetical protein
LFIQLLIASTKPFFQIRQNLLKANESPNCKEMTSGFNKDQRNGKREEERKRRREP